MKIGFVSNVNVPGRLGPSVRTMEIARALASLGNEVHLFGHLEKQLPLIDNLHFHVYPKFALPELKESAKLLRKMDVVYERFSYLYCNVGFFLSRIINQPIVFEVHGFPVDEEKAIWRDMSLRTTYSLRARLRFPSTYVNLLFPEKLLEWVETKILSYASLIIVTARKTKNILVQRGIKPEKIHRIRNAVDPELFSPKTHSRSNFATSNETIITLASYLWTPIIQTILRTAKLLKEEPIKFLIFGEIYGEKSSSLRRIIRSLKSNNVIFHDAVPHKEVSEILATSDIILILYSLDTSLFNRGFYYDPIRIYEALSMGKPVILTKIGDLAEEFKDANIFFTEMDNPQDLAKKIRFIVNNKKRVEQRSKKNRDLVLERHTWEKRAERISELLESVVYER